MAAAKAVREPPGLTPILRALWRDGNGDWEGAHSSPRHGRTDGARVHAYLHRKEGDSGTPLLVSPGRPVTLRGPLDVEWAALARDFLPPPPP